jgi:two-component system, NarL family, sensor kinase
VATIVSFETERRGGWADAARAGGGDRVVERIAAAAVGVDVPALLDVVGQLLVDALPVDRCDPFVVAANGPVEGALEVPIGAHGERFGALRVSADGAAPLLTSAQRAQVRGVADVLALAIRAQQAPALVRAERDRIAQDLHDSVGQVITGIGLELAARLADEADPDEWAWLAKIHGLIARADQEMRQAIEGLLSGESAGELASAIEGLCREAEGAAGGGLRVQFEVRGTAAPLGAAGEDALFRVGREALLNVQRHANATTVQVELNYGVDSVTLSVRDDGVGLAGSGSQLSAQGHFGIRTMRHRIEDAGGTLHVRPVTPHGVLVEAVIQGRKVTAHAAGTGGGHR